MTSWNPDVDFDASYESLGQEMYEFAGSIFPFPRSITGNGVRDTLAEVKKHLPELVIHEVPTGTTCFDWIVPDEWNVRAAYIANMDGKKIVDFKHNNLHLMGYSVPVNDVISRRDLDDHLYSMPETPDAIPYTTSYYQRNWGFCLTQNQREMLKDSQYRILIDTDLAPGYLTYADLVIPGESDREILISTYTCHPSLANNETSGPTLATYLAAMLSKRKNRFTYRIVFAPETIGAVVYLAHNLDHLKEMTLAGFILTCVGDDRSFSFMPSRHGNTVADRAARRVLEKYAPDFHAYDFIQHRASDERQYCSPGADLPVVSMMRTAYGRYPEYHTSKDNMNVISASGFAKSFYLHKKVFEDIEKLRFWQSVFIGEPQLSRRNLRSGIGGQRSPSPLNETLVSDILAMSDGRSDNLKMAEEIGEPLKLIDEWGKNLVEAGLLREIGC